MDLVSHSSRPSGSSSAGSCSWVRGLRSVGRATLRLPRWVRLLCLAGSVLLLWYLSGQANPLGSGWRISSLLLSNLCHAPMFGLIAYWLVSLAPSSERGAWPLLGGREAAWIIGACVAYGISDEFHQSLVPGRDASWLDVVTDGVGAWSVVWTASYLGRDTASGRGLRRRLLIGGLACLGAACAATAWNHRVGPGPWV